MIKNIFKYNTLSNTDKLQTVKILGWSALIIFAIAIAIDIFYIKYLPKSTVITFIYFAFIFKIIDTKKKLKVKIAEEQISSQIID